MNWERQRFIETQPCREQSVVSVDVRRAPVVGNRSVQTLCSVRVNSPQGLACHPVQEEVSGLWFSCRRLEFAGVVGCAELIKPGVSLTSFDIVESSYRRRFFARSESDFKDTHRSPTKLR